MNTSLIIVVVASLAAGISLAQATGWYLENRELEQTKKSLLDRVITANSEQEPVADGQPGQMSSESVLTRSSDTKQNEVKTGKLLTSKVDELLKRLIPASIATKLNSQKQSDTKLLYDTELAMLIDITTLGMRAGMAFDQAFEMALRRFPGQLAELCLAKLLIWQRGLISREQGLHELENEVQTVLFSRFAALVLRALRYGAPMTALLSALSDETRRDIRVRREEEVAKAPVKMLIPTGVLILPAMLLLVLGPIMLDLFSKM